jgi:hypothetical protein
MTKLIFGHPRKFVDSFQVPVDTTSWRPDDIEQKLYRKVKSSFTSNRDLASFSKLKNSLIPLNDDAAIIKSIFGVYMLAFGGYERNHPPPAFYVGVAGGSSKSPEGILTRLRKHRVKATGSNLGNNFDSAGPVSHTLGWQQYAPSRSQFFTNSGKADSCEESRFVIGEIDGGENRTCILEYFEHAIFNNTNGVREKIYNLIWGDYIDAPHMLTTRSNSGVLPESPQIELWDGSIFCV